MREPTEREIFLQNLLATSSTLLFRSVRAIERGHPDENDALVIEIETWFREAQSQLRAEITRDEQTGPTVVQAVQVIWVKKTESEKLNYFLGK